MNNAKKKTNNNKCPGDCTCSICRQLYAAIRPSSDDTKSSKKSIRNQKKNVTQPKCLNDNFILKKSVCDVRHINMMMDTNNNCIKKSLSYQEISKKLEANYQNNYRRNFEQYKKMQSTSNLNEDEEPIQRQLLKPSSSGSKLAEHKTVIYFGDSFRKMDDDKPKLEIYKQQDLYHARRLCEELKFNRDNSVRRSKNFSALRKKAEAFAQSRADKIVVNIDIPLPPPPPPPLKENIRMPKEKGLSFAKHLKNVLLEKPKSPPENKIVIEKPSNQIIRCEKPVVPEKISIPKPVYNPDIGIDNKKKKVSQRNKCLPSYIESVVNGVINIRIEENFKAASRIVEQVHEPEKKRNNYKEKQQINTEAQMEFFDEDIDDHYDERDDFDWSFVQEWRAR